MILGTACIVQNTRGSSVQARIAVRRLRNTRRALKTTSNQQAALGDTSIVRIRSGMMKGLEWPLAPGAHELTFLLAFQADTVQKPFPDHGVVTIGNSSHHMPTVIAQVMNGLLACDIPLIEVEYSESHQEENYAC
jgi:hypothetical protein